MYCIMYTNKYTYLFYLYIIIKDKPISQKVFIHIYIYIDNPFFKILQ